MSARTVSNLPLSNIDVQGEEGPDGFIQGYTTFLPSTPTMSRPAMGANTTTLILAANTSRKRAVIMNNTANTIWIKEGAVGVLSQGFPVQPGGYYDVITNAAVHGWNAGGAVTLDVLEAT